MRVPRFRPARGRLSGHVFENLPSGVRRALYWTLRGDFEPMEIDGSEWRSSVRVEWLTFDLRRWPDLSGAELAAVRDPGMLEASVYFTAIHQPADLLAFRVQRLPPGSPQHLAPGDASISIDASSASIDRDATERRVEMGAAPRFDGSIEVSCELELLDGTTLPRSTVIWTGEMEFEGIHIVPENLFPKPLTPAEAIGVLGAFIDPSDFAPPEREDRQWTFLPLDPSA